MADAFEMLVRSFNAQYRGLSDTEREWLAEQKAAVRVDHVAQQVLPIWTVERQGEAIFVVSIKQDVVGYLR